MSSNTRPFSRAAYPLLDPAFMDEHMVQSNPVAEELAALREEVRQLRLALIPPKSVILVGSEVDRLYSALKQGFPT